MLGIYLFNSYFFFYFSCDNQNYSLSNSTNDEKHNEENKIVDTPINNVLQMT